MKKDVKNVCLTFSLIALVVLGGSFFQGKIVSAERAAEKIAEEKKIHEQELLSMQAQQQARQAQEAEDERLAKEEALAEEKIRIVQAQDQSAKAQAAYLADVQARQEAINRSNAEAAVLAQQQAEAQIAAQKLADQKAADAQAKKKASRKSRAS